MACPPRSGSTGGQLRDGRRRTLSGQCGRLQRGRPGPLPDALGVTVPKTLASSLTTSRPGGADSSGSRLCC